jgi:hypothetical protein
MDLLVCGVLFLRFFGDKKRYFFEYLLGEIEMND